MKNKSVFKYLAVVVIFILAVISISVYKKNKLTIETKTIIAPTLVSITPTSTSNPTPTSFVVNPISNIESGDDISSNLDANFVSSLKTTVFSAVNAELKARYSKEKDKAYLSWDEKVEIMKVHTSAKAAAGKWWNYDAWDWIAWQLDDGSWKVIPNFDGYNCQELETVPSQYNDFFKNQIYPNFGGDEPDKKFCY